MRTVTYFADLDNACRTHEATDLVLHVGGDVTAVLPDGREHRIACGKIRMIDGKRRGGGNPRVAWDI